MTMLASETETRALTLADYGARIRPRTKQKPGAASAGIKGQEEWTMTMLARETETRALTLADYEARIHLYKEQIGTGYIGIGRTLLEAKEAKVVPHGQWEAWVTETTGLTARQAQRCMQAATEIKDGSAMARLEMSKALLLLGSGLDEEAREEIAAKTAEDGATVKALKEEIRQARLKLVQETGAAAEIRDALRKTAAERDQIEMQMRAANQAWKDRLEEARESGYQRGNLDGQAEAIKQARDEIREQMAEKQKKIDYINSERKRAEQSILELREQLKHAEAAGSARWDEGYRAGQEEIARLKAQLEKEIEYGERLAGQMEKKEEEYREQLEQLKKDGEEHAEAWEKAERPAEYEKDREILIAAAEEAEKRAADAEAELEALKAVGAGQPEPVWKVLKLAAQRFMTDCELMPMDPAALISDQSRIRTNVNWIGSWVDMMRKALDAAVQAEGAVE